MAIQLKLMKGEEFIKKILAGERNFEGVNLEEGSDLSGHEGYAEMQSYLRQQNFRLDCITIENSRFRHVKAIGLYLPYVIATRADFYGAYLPDANLESALLIGANFESAYLVGTNLGHADLVGAKLNNADLRAVNSERADFAGTDFYGANLAGVRNLEKSLWLQAAHFFQTRVTPEEKEIIEAVLKGRELKDLFVVVEQ